MSRRMAAYESAHSVDEYHVQGWCVWPLLRTSLSRSAIDESLSKQCRHPDRLRNSSIGLTIKSFLRRVVPPALSVSRRRSNANPPDLTKADAVVLGVSTRLQTIGRETFELVTDPVADIMQSEGLVCRRWIVGSHGAQCAQKTDFVDGPLYNECQRISAYNPKQRAPNPPKWFLDFQHFQETLGAKRWDWELLNSVAYTIYVKSLVFENWLYKISPKILFLDCWYNWDMFACTLGARRCGVNVVDVQHGVQENLHFAYHNWTRSASPEFNCMPDTFWVWGQSAASLHADTNTIGTRALPLGNPWIQKWLYTPSTEMKASVINIREELSGYAKKILITTGKPTSTDLPYLKTLIDESPSEWAWLIRVHPALPQERLVVRRELSDAKHQNVFIELGCDTPLHALLQNVDHHVTRDSTCALEAMCFGVATSIIAPVGKLAFREFLERGVMSYCESPRDLIEFLHQPRVMTRECLAAEVAKVFGKNELLSATAIHELLSGSTAIRDKAYSKTGRDTC